MSEEGASRQGQREVDGDVTDPRGSGPFVDAVFEVLADWRRREICQFFVETDAPTASVEDLAVLVAGCRPEEVPADRSHEAVVAALEEDHLPVLARAGVVDYDPRSGTVRYRGQATVEKWLEHVAAVDLRAD